MAKYRNEAERHADVMRKTEAMRSMNPERFDAVAKTVRRNVDAVKQYRPHAFMRKH